MGEASTPKLTEGSGSPDEAVSTPATKAGVEQLDFGVAAADGKVVIRFSHEIHWFDMEPSLAIQFAESIVNCSIDARDQQIAARGPSLIMPPGFNAMVKN